jgi:hypothetical protein
LRAAVLTLVGALPSDLLARVGALLKPEEGPFRLVINLSTARQATPGKDR